MALGASASLDDLVDRRSGVQQVVKGCVFTEGPIWMPNGSLLFSDIPANQMWRWHPTDGKRLVRSPNNKGNGMTLDNSGRLIVCEHATSMVTARDERGRELEVLASHFQGHELNSPNDVIVSRTGDVIFTDPTYGRTMESVGVLREVEQPVRGVYRLVGGVGPLELVVGNVEQPNGLCLSVDESTLYVGDTAKGHIRAFERRDGRYVDSGTVFAEGISETSAADDGFVDGLKLDELGNVYVTGPGGVWIFAPGGDRIGVIEIPEQVANLNWGGPDWKSLYVTANTSVYCVRMAVAGNRLGYMR